VEREERRWIAETLQYQQGEETPPQLVQLMRHRGPLTHDIPMKLRTALVLLGLFCSAPAGAFAAIIFTASITHDQESAPNGTAPLLTATGAPRPLSFGTAIFTLNDAGTQLSFTATINNIDVTGTQTADTNDNLLAAHIHAPAAPGANGSVVWGFFGSPDNDINPDNLVVTPFATGVGGTFSSIWDVNEGNGGTTLTAQLPNILAGLSYINFHTVQFGGGEIRGQIIPPGGGVPDSGSAGLLLALSLVSLWWLRRRSVS
jgi:hypothetical protein